MEPEDLLRAVVDTCGKLGIPYFVTGSTATIAYGEPRFTNDIDVVINLNPPRLSAQSRLYGRAGISLQSIANESNSGTPYTRK